MAIACAMPTRAVRSAVRTRNRLDLLRLPLAKKADLLRFRRRKRLDTGGFLSRPLVLGLSLVRLDVDRQFRFGDERLLLRTRLRLAELLLFHRGLLLPGVGFHLLFGDLPRSELRQDRLDLASDGSRRRGADENLLQLEVVLRELFLHLLARYLLDGTPILDELNQSPRLADVLEVRRDHGVKCLLDQALDIAEALNHEWRFPVVDVNDHR
jgi:hypothetical protein